ncbi:MAG: hypothetical protein JSS82_15960 [Bacteroidetes bacterium]|nr:hypothetical protein [Bacteroidota bacterium]
MRSVFCFFLLLSICISSCSSAGEDGTGNKPDSSAANAAPVFDSSLPKGKLIDSLACKKAADQTYALYLPSSYASDKSYPCIYFFDAHRRGGLPINMYKRIAEKYGFVLIGSNNSKNGLQWPEAHEIAKAMMDDSRSRINIDPYRIYTAGFSGGSRVACALAMQDGGVAAVLGIAAAYPAEQGTQSKFDYFGMVGDRDFNLNEMRQWDASLDQNGMAHQLLTSGATHGWASADDMEMAMLWIQARAMKNQKQPRNDSLLMAIQSEYKRRIAAMKQAGDWIKLHELLSGIVEALDGLNNITAWKKELTDLQNNAAYKQAVQKQSQLQLEEQTQQREFGGTFASKDEMYWTAKIATLKAVRPLQESQMNGRLLAYLGFVAYMNANNALKAADLNNSSKAIHIFRLADPKNPDGAYLQAVYELSMGDKDDALKSLREAVRLGYNDVGQLKTDQALASIRTDASFAGIVAVAATNAK